MDRSSYQLRITDGLAAVVSKKRGVHAIDDDNPYYVTLRDLQEYWTNDNMTQAFRSCHSLDHESGPLEWHETIRESFLRLFSLLVSIGRLETIHESFMQHRLTDASFPLTEFPRTWPDTSLRQELFEKILEEQWKFFPLVFDQRQLFNPALSSRHILPITKIEPIQRGTEIAVDVIYVDPACTVDVGPQGAEPIQLVRKQYIGENHHSGFVKERRAHEALRNHNYYESAHIVRCFGAFSHVRNDGKKASNLILEHVNGGNLEDFYAQCPRPKTRKELIDFWTSLSGAFDGLYVTHQAHQESNASVSHPQIVHQDVKPTNLLLSRAEGHSTHIFTIKLADFGFSSTNNSTVEEIQNSGIGDLGGGQTYSAPDNSHHEHITHHGFNKITAAVDVWSMGCILSEACVWLVAGLEGIEAYEKRRAKEIRQDRQMTEAGHTSCFHSGLNRLREVDMTHKKVRGRLPEYDDITPKIIEMIEEKMLLSDADSRKTTLQLFRELRGFLNFANYKNNQSVDAISLFTLSDPDKRQEPATRQNTDSTPTTSKAPNGNKTTRPSGHLRHESSSVEELLKELRLSYAEAREFRRCRKNNLPVDTRVEAAIKSLKNSLRSRDFIYFIDNSVSLATYKQEVREALLTYAYITKLIDTNGIEASFASDPGNLRPYPTTSKLMNEFDKKDWTDGSFEDRLSNFIDDCIIPRLPAYWKKGPLRPKRLSIIVLTDGRWGSGTLQANGVERPINKLINKMTEPGVQASRTQVSIQFMRFGEDEDGIRHLDVLDHLGTVPNMDIVDTKPYHSDVRKMLIGPLDETVDKDGELPHPANSFPVQPPGAPVAIMR